MPISTTQQQSPFIVSCLRPQAQASPDEGRAGAIVHGKLVVVRPHADTLFRSALFTVRHDCLCVMQLVHGQNLANLCQNCWLLSFRIMPYSRLASRQAEISACEMHAEPGLSLFIKKNWSTRMANVLFWFNLDSLSPTVRHCDLQFLRTHHAL